MKRSIRKLAGFTVVFPGRRLGTVVRSLVSLSNWHISRIDVGGRPDFSDLSDFSDRVLLPTRCVEGIDGGRREIHITPVGEFVGPRILTIGEHSEEHTVAGNRIIGLRAAAPCSPFGRDFLVTDLVFDDHTWLVEYLLFGERPGSQSLIPIHAIDGIDLGAGRIRLSYSRWSPVFPE